MQKVFMVGFFFINVICHLFQDNIRDACEVRAFFVSMLSI